jgi:protein-S-isoprenylcysteine O-methyltransferase Ste14
MSTSPVHSSAAASKKIGAAGLIARLIMFVFFLSLPFLAAGTLAWPQGLIYLGLMLFLVGGSRVLMARKYPDLVQERVHAADMPDSKKWDRPLSAIIGLWGTLVVWIVAGLNVRFGWPPPIPIGWQILGAIVFVLSTIFGTWAMLENRFFSAVVRIQTDRGHTVVTTGPYRFIRHPGYAAGILGYLAMPLLLNSMWAFIPALLTIGLIVVRTKLEDKTLRAELPGYTEYTQHTRYRLLPGIW